MTKVMTPISKFLMYITSTMATWKPSSLLEIADKASFSSQNIETAQLRWCLISRLTEWQAMEYGDTNITFRNNNSTKDFKHWSSHYECRRYLLSYLHTLPSIIRPSNHSTNACWRLQLTYALRVVTLGLAELRLRSA